MFFQASRNLLVTLLLLALALPSAAQAKRKKKLSLAQLAALEWKLEQATNSLTGNADASARKKALGELAKIDDPRVVKPLAMALKEDPDASLRQAAAEALAKIKTPESKGLLTLAAQADPNAAVRAIAQKALKTFPRRTKPAALRLKARKFKAPKGKIDGKVIKKVVGLPSGDARLWAVGQAKAISFKGRESLLKKHLRTDPSARVRARAANVLAALAKRRSLPDLIRALSDGDPTVRFAIATLIAAFDDPGALLALQKLAAEDADKSVKEYAADLLEPSTRVGRRLLKKRISTLRSANPTERIRALNELASMTNWRAMVPMSCTLLSDKSVAVRTMAAKTLTNMHDTSVLTALRAAAVIEPDAKQKKQVRSLLKSMRRRVDDLIKKLKSKEVMERLRAARALGQAAYPPGLKPLIRASKDKDPRVRRAAIRGLTNFGSKKANDALRVAGSDPDKKARKIVDEYFKQRDRLKGWRKFFRDSNRLVTKTMDKNPTWRADAAIGLGIAGAEATVDSLVNLLLRDKKESVRLAAAWALVLMASDAGEKALRKAAAKDKSERVRLAARKYLVIEKIGVPDLLAQIADEKASVRQDAAEALSLRASSKVLYHLIRASMCDSEAKVRAASLRGLARIGNPLARTVIKVARARDSSRDVKRVATMMYILAGGK